MSKNIVDDYLKPEELAAQLEVTVRTLNRWVAAGFGPPKTRIANRTLYSAEAVRQWLKRHERQPLRAWRQ